MIRSLLTCAMLVALTACSLSTEPGSDGDAGTGPYVVSPAGVRIHGTSRALVVLARFADGPESPLTSANIAAQLFAGPNGGPLAETYSLASGGTFTLRGDVTEWVTTPITREASSKPGVITESGSGDFAFTALQAVDPQVDFGTFDDDGPDGIPNSGDDDGVVDGGVVFLHSEPNLYCDPSGRGTHPFTLTKWRPNGTRFKTQDAARNGGVIEIGAFTLMSATGCTTTTVQSHVVAHELGHLLFRLPDLYRGGGGGGDPVSLPASDIGVWSSRRWEVGCWELMAAGSWGCGLGRPAFELLRSSGLGAWARYAVGWVTPEIAPSGRDATYELLSLNHGGTVLRVPITADEYLLLEYREKQAGDETVPANGILIYHVAESLPVYPTLPTDISRVRLIEADDDSTLDRDELHGGDRGTVGDAFGITRTTLRSGEHSQAVALNGSPFPFELTGMTIDASHHRATVRVSPVTAAAVRAR